MAVLISLPSSFDWRKRTFRARNETLDCVQWNAGTGFMPFTQLDRFKHADISTQKPITDSIVLNTEKERSRGNTSSNRVKRILSTDFALSKMPVTINWSRTSANSQQRQETVSLSVSTSGIGKIAKKGWKTSFAVLGKVQQRFGSGRVEFLWRESQPVFVRIYLWKVRGLPESRILLNGDTRIAAL